MHITALLPPAALLLGEKAIETVLFEAAKVQF